MKTNSLNSPRASFRLSTAPEFFPLPQIGPDPYFGLCRTYYYDLEKAGMITLVRLRKRGQVKGKVLVPYDQVKAWIEKCQAASRLAIFDPELRSSEEVAS